MRRRRDNSPAAGDGLARRALVRGMAGGAGALAALATGADAAAEQEQAAAASDDPTRLNYRETEHVRWFYRRARM
jgi:hypothetical protein